jgi:hypothetical protein
MSGVHFSNSVFVDGHIWSGSRISGLGLLARSDLIVNGSTYLNNPNAFTGTSSMRLLCVASGGGIVGEITWTELLNILDNHYQKKK